MEFGYKTEPTSLPRLDVKHGAWRQTGTMSLSACPRPSGTSWGLFTDGVPRDPLYQPIRQEPGHLQHSPLPAPLGGETSAKRCQPIAQIGTLAKVLAKLLALCRSYASTL